MVIIINWNDIFTKLKLIHVYTSTSIKFSFDNILLWPYMCCIAILICIRPTRIRVHFWSFGFDSGYSLLTYGGHVFYKKYLDKLAVL